MKPVVITRFTRGPDGRSVAIPVTIRTTRAAVLVLCMMGRDTPSVAIPVTIRRPSPVVKVKLVKEKLSVRINKNLFFLFLIYGMFRQGCEFFSSCFCERVIWFSLPENGDIG
jgi:hypothetical protein